MRAFVLGLVLCACGSSMQGGTGGDIRLAAAPAAAGDSIELRLTNNSADDIGYNLCTTAIERQVGTAWQPVQTDRACTMELRTLEAGGETTYRTTLPPLATAGEYRFTTTVEILEAGGRRTISSNTVRIAS
ncbi:MAG TPA: immunoglobulin-like domain-containing protein [Longimicrobiales bacterium]